MPSIAETYVSVFPETSKIAAGIKAAFAEVDGKETGRRLGREIQQGIGETKVDLKADTAKAKAEIDEAARDRTSTIHVGVDRDRAGQAVAQLGSQLAPQAAQAGAQVGSAMGVPLGGALMAAGVTALAGIAAAASGVAGLIPAALGGAGLGIGTLVIGLDGVKDAWDAAGKAAKDSGSDQETKTKAVASATKSLRDAVNDEARAQKDVANARKDARQQLEDLNLELRGGALDETEAVLQAQKAREDLATGMYETSTDYELAQLRVMQADQRVAESHQRNIDLQNNANETRAKGVDGADNVVAANDRLAQTQDRVASAQQNVNDANSKVSASAQDAAEKMAALSPAGQAVISTLQGMMPQFQAFKFAIQDSLLTGLGPQIQQLATTYLPLLQGVMGSMASTMNQAFGSLTQLFQTPEMVASMQSIFDNIGSSFATWSQSITPLVQAFTKIAEVGSTFLPQLADGAVKAAQGFADFIDSASKSGQLQQWIQDGISTMNVLWSVIKTLGQAFMDLAPIGSSVLGALASVLPTLLPSVGPLATAFANMVVALTPTLTMIGQLVSVLLPPLFQMMNNLSGVITTQTGFWTNLSGAISPVNELLGGLISKDTDTRKFFDGIKQGIEQILTPMQALAHIIQDLKDLFSGGAAQNRAQELLDAARNGTTPSTDASGNQVFPGVSGGGGSFAPPGLPGLPTSTGPGGVPLWAGPAMSAGDAQRARRGTPDRPGWGDPDPRAWQWGGPAASAAPSGFNWDAVAAPESGGNWQNNDTGNNGHYGGLQFSPETWKAFGGQEFAAMPNLATPEQQKIVADRTAFSGYNGTPPQGLGAWETITKGMVPGVTTSSTPAMSAYMPPAAMPTGGQEYGLPAGTNTGGYGTGNSSTFPPWVMQMAAAFGIKPSTYSGHQETDRNEAGYAPNPGHENRGIDWSGPVENMQKFSDYLTTIPQSLEQVIWKNPNTGQTDTIAGGRPVSGYYDSATLNEHENHVHTRQSAAIPLPGQMPGIPTGAATDPMYIALSPNIPAGQQKGGRGGDSGGEQLGQDILGGMGEIFGLDGSIFKDPSEFGLVKIMKGLMGLKFADGGQGGGAGGGGGFGGGGGGGGLGSILSMVPQAFGDLKVGSPQDAPGQFMPSNPGAGGTGGAVLNPFAPPGAAGPGNQGGATVNNFNNQGSNYGYSQTAVQDAQTQAQLPAVRVGTLHGPAS
jgi:hypothetical protein